MGYIKSKSFTLILLSFMMVLSGCEAITGIFKFGVWSGVLIVVGIIALIIFIIRKSSKK